MDPSQQWPYPQQGQPGPQYPQQPAPPQQSGPQYPAPPQQSGPQYPAPQYPVQQPPQYPQQSAPPQQPYYPSQPYSAAPNNVAPNSAAPYSGPPATPYAAPATGLLPAPPRSRSRLMPIVAIVAALLIVMAVAVVVVVQSKSKKDPGTGPGVAAATSYAGPVDPCLVGTWNQTSYQNIVDMAGTDIDKREGIGKVKMTGGGKRWTIKADGSATEDDSKTVYSGKDDKGRTINATFSGNTDWLIKSVGRTIEYTGKESNSSVVISVDGRKAGTINLEPNLDPDNYTCAADVWRTTTPDKADFFSRFDRVK